LKTLLTLSAHIIFDALFGLSLLSIRPNQRTWMETILAGILVGMYAETGLAAILLFAGASLSAAALVTGSVMVITAAAAYAFGGRHLPRFTLNGVKWFEWVSLLLIAGVALLALWQLTRTPTYFDDALQHWSGRARALYGGVNWSFDPHSPFFMGAQTGNNNYPLLVVIWRTLSAKLAGGWNETISRADGLIFFIVIVGTIWLAVRRFSNTRWLAAACAGVAATVPLQALHAAAGYSDIAVEAFTIGSLAAVLRKEWFLAGVIAAGFLWCKNDGLFLYLPGLVAAVALIDWRKLGTFCAGLATIAPWFIFNSYYSLGTTSGHAHLGWHPAAPRLLWHALVESSASSILWISVVACVACCSTPMFRNESGRGLLAAFAISFAAILFVFSFSNSFEFLRDQTTFHRTMLQFSGPAILISAYGLSLRLDREGINKPKRKARGS
jgi:hypothetical protein